MDERTRIMIKELVVEFRKWPDWLQSSDFIRPVDFDSKSSEWWELREKYPDKFYDSELNNLHTWFNFNEHPPGFVTLRNLGIHEKFDRLFKMIEFKTKLRDFLRVETNYDVDEFIEWFYKKNLKDMAPVVFFEDNYNWFDEIIHATSEITTFSPVPRLFVISFYVFAFWAYKNTTEVKFISYIMLFRLYRQWTVVRDPLEPMEIEKILPYSYFYSLIFAHWIFILIYMRDSKEFVKSSIKLILFGFYVILFYIMKWSDRLWLSKSTEFLDYINFLVDLTLFCLILTLFCLFAIYAKKEQFNRFWAACCYAWMFYGWFIYFLGAGFETFEFVAVFLFFFAGNTYFLWNNDEDYYIRDIVLRHRRKIVIIKPKKKPIWFRLKKWGRHKLFMFATIMMEVTYFTYTRPKPCEILYKYEFTSLFFELFHSRWWKPGRIGDHAFWFFLFTFVYLMILLLYLMAFVDLILIVILKFLIFAKYMCTVNFNERYHTGSVKMLKLGVFVNFDIKDRNFEYQVCNILFKKNHKYNIIFWNTFSKMGSIFFFWRKWKIPKMYFSFRNPSLSALSSDFFRFYNSILGFYKHLCYLWLKLKINTILFWEKEWSFYLVILFFKKKLISVCYYVFLFFYYEYCIFEELGYWFFWDRYFSRKVRWKGFVERSRAWFCKVFFIKRENPDLTYISFYNCENLELTYISFYKYKFDNKRSVG